jgi:alcohol dehydrogenase/L-iditol 2-dehydrogenase
MKAVVLVAPGAVDLVGDWPEPAPGPHDVVVRVSGVGLCGSDLAVFRGQRTPRRCPG